MQTWAIHGSAFWIKNQRMFKYIQSCLLRLCRWKFVVCVGETNENGLLCWGPKYCGNSKVVLISSAGRCGGYPTTSCFHLFCLFMFYYLGDYAIYEFLCTHCKRSVGKYPVCRCDFDCPDSLSQISCLADCFTDTAL